MGGQETFHPEHRGRGQVQPYSFQIETGIQLQNCYFGVSFFKTVAVAVVVVSFFITVLVDFLVFGLAVEPFPSSKDRICSSVRACAAISALMLARILVLKLSHSHKDSVYSLQPLVERGYLALELTIRD